MMRRRDNLGFTLMELVCVLVVIAVAATVAVPALRGFVRARRLPNTAQELMTTARWCRAEAVSEGLAYRLNLDVANSAWSITKDDGSGTNFVSVVSDFIPASGNLPEGIVMKTDVPAQDGLIFITFDPSGRTDVGTIQLTCDGEEVDLICDTPMGSYRVVNVPGGSR